MTQLFSDNVITRYTDKQLFRIAIQQCKAICKGRNLGVINLTFDLPPGITLGIKDNLIHLQINRFHCQFPPDWDLIIELEKRMKKQKLI